jgi:hypothetical protein
MTRTAKTFLAALTSACAVLVLSATGAQAAVTHPYLGSFGPGGPGAGTFGRVEGVAVEQPTQDVYVYDASNGGRIYKFDANDEPVDFSGTGSNFIENVGQAGSAEEELAVDESAGPTKGDIYAANNSEVVVYSAAGVKLGTLSGGEMCGVAVDSAGHVYVGIYGQTVKQYVPTANPVTNEDYVSSLWGLQGICNVAVDGEGNVYAATYGGGVRKYAPSQFNTKEEPAVSIPPGAAFDEHGRTLAVDRSGSLLYTDSQTAIAEYDDEGKPTLQGSFGAQLNGSFGVAVDETSDDVYAGSESRVDMFGPVTTVADVSLEPPATGVGQSSATVHGTVNPLGIAVSGCEIEYWVEHESEAVSTACTPSPGSASSPVAVSATLSGLTGNSTYHYRLAATDADGTSYSETSTFMTLPAPPTLTGQPAVSGVTRTTAQVTAAVGTSDAPTTLTIEYVSADEYRPEASNPYARGASTPSIAVEAAGKDQTVGPIGIVALTPATTYHYRLAAHNAAGTSFGQDGTFTTAAGTPPVVITGAAGEVTQTSVLLTGVVEAQGLQTSYEFEVGTDTTYSGGKLFGNAGQSAGAEGVSAALQYLVPGVTYHYRLVATSEDGTSYGQDMTFTTPGVPTPIVQPPSVPLIASPAVVFPNVPAAGKSSGSKKKGKPSVKKKSSRKKRGKAKRKAAKRASGHPGRTKKGGKKS